MKADHPSIPEFSGDSSFLLNSTNKNQADHTVLQSSNTTALRYLIPEHIPKHRRSQLLLISVTSPHRLRWDFLIMLLAVWNCFYVPFAMAFLTESDGSLLTPVNVLIDLAYICDVGVYARSTYIDVYTGEEVRDSWLILKHYFQSGKVVIDIISAIPFGILSWLTNNTDHYRLLTLIKIARLLRLSKILMFMRTKEQIKLKLKLAQIFFLFFTYLHVIACLWFLLTCENEQYVPPALYLDHEADLCVSSGYRQYAYSLYMSVYMLTGAEIGPRTPWERLFAGSAVLSGQLLQGFFFGQLTVTLLNIHKRGSKVGQLQVAAGTIMVNMRLPKRLHHKIFSYIVSIQSIVTNRQEVSALFNSLPPSYQQEIQESLFRSVVQESLTRFHHCDVTESVLQRLSHCCVQPEDTILSQGDYSDCMYFIVLGVFSVYVHDERNKLRKVREIIRGGKFGEIGLLYHTKRTASVIGSDFGTLAVLKRADFDLLKWTYPQIWTDLEVTALRYQDRWKSFMIKTVLKCPYFASLSEEKLSEIIYSLPFQQFRRGEILYTEGKVVDKAVFILSGKVEVYLSVKDAKTTDLNYPATVKSDSRPSILTFSLRRGSVVMSPKLETAQNTLTKLVIEQLGRGSALCCNLLLLKDKVHYTAKATEATTVLLLTRKMLKLLGRKIPELGESVGLYKSQVMELMEMWPIRKIQLTAVDFTIRKSDTKYWSACMKVKRCALGKLLEKRYLRQEGISDLANLSRRLSAIIEAMAKKDFFLAEKLRRGFLPPTSADLGQIFSLLHSQEVENPLATQFASEAIQLTWCLGHLEEGLLRAVCQFRALEARRATQRKELSEMRRLISLVSKLSLYR